MSAIRAHFDGRVLVPDGPVDLPKDQPLRLVVEIEPASGNGVRRFPMRGRPYQYTNPFESAAPPRD